MPQPRAVAAAERVVEVAHRLLQPARGVVRRGARPELVGLRGEHDEGVLGPAPAQVGGREVRPLVAVRVLGQRQPCLVVRVAVAEVHLLPPRHAVERLVEPARGGHGVDRAVQVADVGAVYLVLEVVHRVAVPHHLRRAHAVLLVLDAIAIAIASIAISIASLPAQVPVVRRARRALVAPLVGWRPALGRRRHVGAGRVAAVEVSPRARAVVVAAAPPASVLGRGVAARRVRHLGGVAPHGHVDADRRQQPLQPLHARRPVAPLAHDAVQRAGPRLECRLRGARF